jgi:hypothetical protein
MENIMQAHSSTETVALQGRTLPALFRRLWPPFGFAAVQEIAGVHRASDPHRNWVSVPHAQGFLQLPQDAP